MNILDLVNIIKEEEESKQWENEFKKTRVFNENEETPQDEDLLDVLDFND